MIHFLLQMYASVLIGLFGFAQMLSGPRDLKPDVPHHAWSLPSSVSPTLVSRAFASSEDWHVDTSARVFILPHHLVAGREIAALLKSLPTQPSTVYLLSPDHFSQGRSDFTTDETPATRALLAREHGVTNLTPFISHAWPSARIVPIMVREDASEPHMEDAWRRLVGHLQTDPQAILIGSIDFSHYLPAEVADFHDVLALDVIRSLDADHAAKVELDSAPALAITLRVARQLQLGAATVHAQTNAFRLMHTTSAEGSTSHVVVSFARGVAPVSAVSTILFMGDIMLERNVAARSRKADDQAFPFKLIRGKENRFFRGQDVVVGNLEGPIAATKRPPMKEIDFAFDPSSAGLLKRMGIDAVSQANNHALDQGRVGFDESSRRLAETGIVAFGDQVLDDPRSSLAVLASRGRPLAFLGFNTTDNPLDEKAALRSLAEAKTSASSTIIFMHWGAEYQAKPNAEQTRLAHWFIDQGADAVIGAHPHWMQSVESYRGKLIAYSLGNFIFDQDWSEETQKGLVIGLVLRDTESAMHLFPISIKQSQPQLLTGAERAERLERLAAISDPALAEHIRSGVLTTQSCLKSCPMDESGDTIHAYD